MDEKLSGAKRAPSQEGGGAPADSPRPADLTLVSQRCEQNELTVVMSRG
jgi:hypothetical protein